MSRTRAEAVRRRGRIVATTIAALLLVLPLACGEWSIKEFGEGERTGEPVETPPPGPAPAPRARPSPPAPRERPPLPSPRDPGEPLPEVPLDRLIQPLPERDLPDTIGTLLERELDSDLPGAPIEEYLLWLPPGLEREERRWPMILYLHGRSHRGDDLDRLTRYGLPRLLDRDRAIPFVVVAPQLPEGHNWSGPGLDRVAAIVEEVARRYAVDRGRIYLTGYSMGGGGAWRMAFRRADLFAAAIPIAAYSPRPTESRVAALQELPILAYHGERDEVAPLERAERMIEALRQAGADAELRTIEEADHGDLVRLYRDPGLYAWLLEHRRGPR